RAGLAVNRSVLAHTDPANGPGTTAIVAGLSNGYMLYVATYDEFLFHGKDGGCAVPTQPGADRDRQSYEGGSTLYGPWTDAFLAEQFGLLSEALVPPEAPEVAALRPATGVATEFSVEPGFHRPRLPEGVNQGTSAVATVREPWVCTLKRPAGELPTLCFSF